MTVRLKTLAGVALALAMFGGQSAAKAADAAPTELQSRNDGWRALAPIGWALDEWEDAIDRFGDLVESLPEPADIVCDTVGRIHPVVRLQCAYWDWINDHHGDDDDDDSDERGSRDDDERGSRDDDERGSRDDDDRGSRGGQRQSDDDDGDDEAGI